MSEYYRQNEENINSFAYAVRDTRNEGTSVSIENIVKCFKEIFNEEELACLIKLLKLKGR